MSNRFPLFFSRTAYPLRYWLCVAYGVGMPGFMFVRSGKSYNTPQAMAQIVFTFVIGFVLVGITASSHRPIHQRRMLFHHKVWVVMLALFALASVISPHDDVAISLYRMGEWCLAYATIASVYTREQGDAKGLIVDLIQRICWVTTWIVLAGLIVAPRLALASMSESGDAVQMRLGGLLYNASTLGTVTSIAAWYCILFMRGYRRTIFAGIAIVAMMLTYARGAWIGFLLAGIAYLVLKPNVLMRVLAVAGGIGAILFVEIYSDLFIRFVSRGQGQRNLENLSERTLIWAAAMQGIVRRPLIGYGYIDGVKPVLARYFTEKWWTPPTCHNEFLQATLSGGIVCALLLAGIYAVAFKRLFAAARAKQQANSNSLFLFLTLIQVIAYAAITPVLTKQLFSLGVILLLCFVAAFDSPLMPRRQYVALRYAEAVAGD